VPPRGSRIGEYWARNPRAEGHRRARRGAFSNHVAFYILGFGTLGLLNAFAQTTGLIDRPRSSRGSSFSSACHLMIRAYLRAFVMVCSESSVVPLACTPKTPPK